LLPQESKQSNPKPPHYDGPDPGDQQSEKQEVAKIVARIKLGDETGKE
jgi:hypothetical protein